MTRGHGEAGFTLLELLVGLVVTGFIVAGLAQGFRFGLAAWDAQARTLSAGGQLDAVDHALRRLVAQMDPVGDGGPPLQGTQNALVFRSPLPDGMPGTLPGLGTRDAAMHLFAARGRLLLDWKVAPRAVALAPSSPLTTTVVLDGVDRLELAFYGAAAREAPAWRRSWGEPQLPRLVRLRIVFHPGDPRHWADIVEAPRQGTAP